MPEWRKPLPTPSGETKPFWDSCRQGQLLVQRCGQCNEFQFYPRGICAKCWSNDIRWVQSSGKGTVWTFTVTYQNRTPGFAEDVPTSLRWWSWRKGYACSPTWWNVTRGR